jgi:aminomethyltransferase
VSRLVPAAETTLRRTALFDSHRAAGARLVPFAGWEMPVQYEGVREEHIAVRRAAGVFDVSHMGQIETRGAGAAALLQRLLSNDVTRLGEGGAQYSVLCRADGGVLDDLFTYRLGPERYLTVTNASNHDRDLAWFEEHAADAPEAEVVDRHADFAMLAVQGPRARGILEGLAGDALPARFEARETTVGGVGALACGTGYTGEDGLELLLAPDDATDLWDALLNAGVVPVGLAARDTLRLESCFHLYGNDLSEQRNPIEAGLGWCCAEATGFIGAEAVAAARERGPGERLVPFAIPGPGIARAGNPIVGGGEVTSGTLSPCLELGIGLAYLPAARATPGERFQIDVRGRVRDAEVRMKPLYPPKET